MIGLFVGPHGVFGTMTAAYTYDRDFVAVGTRPRVDAVYIGRRTTIAALHVPGLVPSRRYGAHVQVVDCTAVPEAAGPRNQLVHGGATDPAFANLQNEIWLDVTNEGQGNSRARTSAAGQFPADRRAHSVAIHDHHKSPDVGEAGRAGLRYGCLTAAL